MRRAAVWWMYACIAGHLLVGVLLAAMADASLLDTYHRGIESAFWQGAAPSAARHQQTWWLALFGPTVQAAALWMAGLAWIGNRERSAAAWIALLAGLALWAPQDMLISLRAGAVVHVWIDAIALALMVPPLAYLAYIDFNKDQPADHAGSAPRASLAR